MKSRFFACFVLFCVYKLAFFDAKMSELSKFLMYLYKSFYKEYTTFALRNIDRIM